MEYKKCQHCQSSIMIKKPFIIKTLKGNELEVDGELYCGKNCFLSYNLIIEASKLDTSQNKEKNSYLSLLIKEEMKLKTS